MMVKEPFNWALGILSKAAQCVCLECSAQWKEGYKQNMVLFRYSIYILL